MILKPSAQTITVWFSNCDWLNNEFSGLPSLVQAIEQARTNTVDYLLIAMLFSIKPLEGQPMIFFISDVKMKRYPSPFVYD